MVRKRKRPKAGRSQKLAAVKGRLAFLHGIRDTVIKDKTRIRLYQEPRKDRCLARDIGKNWKASVE
jgi:hypothetical protein